MKKLFALLLTAAMLFSLAACGSGSKYYGKYNTVADGKLTVATSPDFAPYEFYAIDADGKAQLAGFDMALAQYIADYLGLELEVVPMDFDGTIGELTNNKCDLGMAGYSPDPDRAEVMDFSDVYITGGQSFVCLQSNKDKFQSLDDANKSGIQVAAQIGSIQMDLAEQYSANAEIVPLSKVTDIITELVAGKLDGAYVETMVAESYAKNYSDLCIVLEVPYDAEGSVVGVRKGNEELLKGVNEAIAEVLSTGKMGDFVAEANELANGEIIEGLLEN